MADRELSAATGYGPCVICGDMNYSLSCGGPTICPKCDCGNFDAATVMKQAKVIASLREQLSGVAQASKEQITAQVLLAMSDKVGSDTYGVSYAMKINKGRAEKAAESILSLLASQPSPAATVETKPFYGAEYPSYPNCNGGCGLGCTHDIEQRQRSSAATGDDIELLRADIRDSRAINDALRDEIDRLRAVPQPVAVPERYVVQSEQVRGESRSYWIEPRPVSLHGKPAVIEDFGTNRRKAEKRCAELNAALSLTRPK